MGSADMSKRAHLWLRLAALAVIAAAAYLPRGAASSLWTTAQSPAPRAVMAAPRAEVAAEPLSAHEASQPESAQIHAPVAQR
jgi:hypothetical protein